MSDPPRTDATGSEGLEAEIRRLVERGDLQAAATLFMQSYGGEILSFLHLRLHGDPRASEVFSQFAEDFWRGLPGFRWKTTIRSWSYALARNAAHRSRRNLHREEALPTHPSRMLEGIQAQRSGTPRHLQSDVKNRMRELRLQLPVDDQALLVLRIDKGLSWNELASVFSGKGEELEPADRTRWAARLRQRFVAVKAQLRALAEADGLI